MFSSSFVDKTLEELLNGFSLMTTDRSASTHNILHATLATTMHMYACFKATMTSHCLYVFSIIGLNIQNVFLFNDRYNNYYSIMETWLAFLYWVEMTFSVLLIHFCENLISHKKFYWWMFVSWQNSCTLNLLHIPWTSCLDLEYNYYNYNFLIASGVCVP